jgi:hypothetical protein
MKKDALETLGSIITKDETRDAVHVACLPAQAHERLNAGQHIGYSNGVATTAPPYVGIVDPFLQSPVAFKEWFWILLYPRTITGLRHLWSHPDIPEHESAGQMNKEKAYEILEHYAYDSDGLSTEDLIKAATHFQETGKAYCFNFTTCGVISAPEAFWQAWSVYTGKPAHNTSETYFWRCAC